LRIPQNFLTLNSVSKLLLSEISILQEARQTPREHLRIRLALTAAHPSITYRSSFSPDSSRFWENMRNSRIGLHEVQKKFSGLDGDRLTGSRSILQIRDKLGSNAVIPVHHLIIVDFERINLDSHVMNRSILKEF
jgi:hypothetical protein